MSKKLYSLLPAIILILAACQPKLIPPPEVAPPPPPAPEIVAPQPVAPPPPEPAKEIPPEAPPPADPMAELRQSFRQALALFRQGDMAQAQLYLEQLEDKYPPLNDYILHYLAQTKYKLGDYSGAISVWDKLLKLYPQSRFAARAKLGLADSHTACLEYSPAAGLYKELLKSKEVERAEIEYKLAGCLEYEQSLTSAMTYYHDIWLRYPASGYAEPADERRQLLAEDYGEPIPEITPEDQWQRINRLFSAGKHKAAMTELEDFISGFPHTPFHGQAHIKQALCYKQMKQEEQAIEILSTIPEIYPGREEAAEAYYLLGKLYWNKGQNDQAIKVFERVLTQTAPNKWQPETCYLIARVYEEAGDWNKAAEYHQRLVDKYPSDTWAQSACFRLGWVNYQLGNHWRAANYFKQIRRDSQFFRSSLFWRGRTAETLADWSEAGAIYNQIIREFPASYYAHLATQRLAANWTQLNPVTAAASAENSLLQSASVITVSSMSDPFTLRYYLSQEGSFHFDRMEELVRLLEFNEAVAELDLTAQAGISEAGADARYLLSQLYRLLGEYNKSMQAIQGLAANAPGRRIPSEVWQLCYPAVYEEYIAPAAQAKRIDPYLALAVIRQESAFNPRVKSPANAMGLMQIIPATGQKLADSLKLQDWDSRRLYDPQINITLGITYLAELIERYKNNLALAIAAYNAGEAAVDKWIARYPTEDMPRFIENIPYPETRNYVKQVIGNYLNYLSIYKEGRSFAL